MIFKDNIRKLIHNLSLGSGFTITELVVVIAVVALAGTAGTVSVLNFNERAQLEQEGATFKNNLRLAQEQANSGEKDIDKCGDRSLAGWCVAPDGSETNSYFIYGSCGDAPAVQNPVPDPVFFPDKPQVFTFSNTISLDGYNCTGPDPGDCAALDTSGAVLFESTGNGAFFAGAGEYSADLPGGTITRVVYCLESNAPSLGNDKFFKLEVLQSGEIIDHGVQASCP